MTRWCLTPLGQQIVAANRGIAGEVARRFSWTDTSAADRRSAAYLGLCTAAATYNPTLGIRFSTYAYRCCQREVWEDYGRDHVIRQPRHVLEDRVSENLREQARRTQHVELYPPDVLADRVLDPHEMEVADSDPRPERIARLMERYLTSRERSIIQSHLAGRTFVAIGLEWGISKERVRQIEASAFRRIRTMMGVVMTAKEACAFVMPFGKHRLKTLRDIAIDDPDGARYLDWVVGLKGLRPELKDALRTFLAIPWVEKMVEESLDSREYDEPPENAHEPRPWWEK